MALHNYSESYDAILDGFDKKLLATSSITASFINGEEHIEMSLPKYMGSFSYDKKSNTLYAMSIDSKLQKVNIKSGGAIDVVGFEESNLSNYLINDIAVNSKDNIIYATTYTKELLSIDLKSKEIKIIYRLGFIGLGVAYIDNTFYISNDKKLYKLIIGEKATKPKLLKTYKNKLDTLTILDNKLYGVNRVDNYVFNIDINTLKYSIEVQEFSPNNTNIHHLGVDKNNFYMGMNNLMIYERNSSRISEDNFGRLYRDDTRPMYLKYIKPMIDIKNSLNLTYHYTFNLLYNKGENNCFYIIDVNEGGDYSPTGSYDTMDEDDILGAENIMLRDKTYVSDVKLWEKWGLLKVAYAGIKDKNGKVVAITGADVDVSIINIKTRDALIQSIIIGILALIIGIYASYYIAVKIIRPIEVLKYSALKIAAGNYGDNISINSPQELHKLSTDFNNMSNELKSTIANFGEYKLDDDSNDLTLQLQDRLNQSLVVNNRYIKIFGLEESKNIVGIIKNRSSYYIYSLDEALDTTLNATKKRAVINNILTQLLKGNHTDKFIKIFNPTLFLEINRDSKIEDILTKDITDIGKSKDIEFLDIKISIRNERISS